MRNLTNLEQATIHNLGAYGLTTTMLLNLNLPDREHIDKELKPFTHEHVYALRHLIIENGFSAQAACEEIKELNPLQAMLISDYCRAENRIRGHHLRKLQMGETFDYAHSELVERLLQSRKLTPEEICEAIRHLSAEEANAMSITLFNQRHLFTQPHQDCRPSTTLLWECISFFGSKKIDGKSRQDFMSGMPKHLAEKVALAAKLS